jgi:metal-responsive CopG/Arc/MetJ family transcriptional regulator
VSRSELIRRALARELDMIRATQEREAMAESFRAMKNDETYLREAEALDAALDEPLPQETDRWWSG